MAEFRRRPETVRPGTRQPRPVELRRNERADLWQVWRGKDLLVATANEPSALAWLERNGYEPVERESA